MTKRVTRVGRAWGVAVRESFSSVVAYVVEASVREGRAVLHRVTAGVHCNLAVNPRTVEAQVQGAAVMGLSMCLPGSAITLKDGEVQQSNFGDFTVARMTDMPAFDVHVVPSADAPTGTGELGLPPLAPAFANAVAPVTLQPGVTRHPGRSRHLGVAHPTAAIARRILPGVRCRLTLRFSGEQGANPLRVRRERARELQPHVRWPVHDRCTTTARARLETA